MFIYGQSCRLRGDSFLLFGFLLQAVQEIRCLLGMGCGAENRPLVIPQI
ncbi:MAG: hypothetical protein WBO29_08370 [Albidovulum sp.]